MCTCIFVSNKHSCKNLNKYNIGGLLMHGWMASLTRWTWVWVISRSWWWTGRPGVLQFMGSQRVGHDWATDLIWLMHACHGGSWQPQEKCVTFLQQERGGSCITVLRIKGCLLATVIQSIMILKLVIPLSISKTKFWISSFVIKN